MVARPVIFVLFSIFTCCCESTDTIPDDFKFEERVIGLDFVQYELGILNNFQDAPVGRQELEFNRALNYVRAQSIRAARPP